MSNMPDSSKGMTNNWVKIVAVVGLVAIVAAIAIAMTREAKSAYGVIKAAPDFQLTDQDGETVSLSGTHDQVRLVYFFYSFCPDVCQSTTHELTLLQKRLKADGAFGESVRFLQITFDPERDTAERLKQFAEGHGIDFSGWSLLRGEEEATAKLAYDYGISVIKDEKSGLFIHTNLVILVDKEGNIRNYYKEEDLLDTDKIAKELLVLTKE